MVAVEMLLASIQMAATCVNANEHTLEMAGYAQVSSTEYFKTN